MDRSVWLLLMFALGLALAVVIGGISLYVVAGMILIRCLRKECPRCRSKALRMTNLLLCNPPPNYALFTCERCGGLFVQVGRNKGSMIPREGSSWESDPLWMDPDRG